jgi:hypothetical protein
MRLSLPISPGILIGLLEMRSPGTMLSPSFPPVPSTARIGFGASVVYLEELQALLRNNDKNLDTIRNADVNPLDPARVGVDGGLDLDAPTSNLS